MMNSVMWISETNACTIEHAKCLVICSAIPPSLYQRRQQQLTEHQRGLSAVREQRCRCGSNPGGAHNSDQRTIRASRRYSGRSRLHRTRLYGGPCPGFRRSQRRLSIRGLRSHASRIDTRASLPWCSSSRVVCSRPGNAWQVSRR